MVVALSPTLVTEDEALSLVETVMQHSQAEEVVVTVSNSEASLTRYSENQISQNVNSTNFSLSITSYFGQRSATASTTELELEAILTTLNRSEELARIAPEDPEWVPVLPPQTYADRVPAFDLETAHLSPLVRAQQVQQVCEQSARAKVEGSGTLSTEAELYAIGNSQGLRACNRLTQADFSFTARIDNGSGWTQRTGWSLAQIPIAELTETVIERAYAARNPREVSPGVYPVVFDGAAFDTLLSWVMFNLDARAADEGRSFMSKVDEQGKPLGNRLGETLFSPQVNVRRDPGHPLLQTGTFSGGGLKQDQLDIIKEGVPQALAYSRYWAQKQGVEPRGNMYPFVMQDCDQSLDDLIRQTERGILVNRAWYVRYVNPRTLEVTGMTRDGTFWIEAGKIAYPIKNLRFNQSLPDMLKAVDGLSRAYRYGSTVSPGVRVSAFNFSSVTDSV
ncbi:MAG: TldD/PmbA family protein [Oscillatoriales cyanobacterium SM2_3_0]|nr:TldD/PmbA family protein [Oscillatoriales cyanobacterium SM2_3_0]